MAPTDEQGAAGLLPIRVGSETYLVPVLGMAYADNWVAGLWKALNDVFTEAAGDTSPDTPEGQNQLLQRLNSVTNERALDLVIAFDRKGTLPPKRDLMATGSPKQFRAALEAMKEECLPFAEEMTFMAMAAEVVRSRLQSSTSGPSATSTTGPQTSSGNASPTDSSASSGKRGNPRKRGSTAS